MKLMRITVYSMFVYLYYVFRMPSDQMGILATDMHLQLWYTCIKSKNGEQETGVLIRCMNTHLSLREMSMTHILTNIYGVSEQSAPA